MTRGETCYPIAVLIMLAACTPLDHLQPRLASSSLGCMRAVVQRYVPANVNDKLQHCLAAAFIARRCSGAEARIASWGKEFTDIFDGGDPSVLDLRADYAGLRCARGAASEQAIEDCCAAQPTPTPAPRH